MPKTKPEPLTADDADGIAKDLVYFAERYSLLAKNMRESNTPRILAQNMKDLRLGVKKIHRAINKAYAGFEDAKMLAGVIGRKITETVVDNSKQSAESQKPSKKKPPR